MGEILKRMSGFRSKIGFELIGPYLIGSFFVFLVFSGLVFYSYQSEIASAKNIQKEIAIRSSREIDFYMQNILHELTLAKKNITCLSCEDQNGKKNLKAFLFGNPSVYKLSVLDEKGNEVYKISKYEDVKNVPERDVFNKEIFEKTFSGQEQYLSDVYISEYNLPSLSIGVPIKDVKNQAVGVIIIGVDLSPLWSVASIVQVGKTGYVYVVDDKGALIAYRDVNLVKQRLESKKVFDIKSFSYQNNGPSTYTSFVGEKVIGTIMPIQSTRWSIVVELPYQEVLEKLFPLFILALLAFFVFAFSTLYFLRIIYRKLLYPITLLKKGVWEIENGNLGKTIDIASKDEIGDFAFSFSQMSQVLKKSREDTETAYEVEKKAHKTLEALGKTKSEFITIAAHQLRTPLNEVRWIIDTLLGDEAESLKNKQELKKVEVSTNHLIDIVNDLLNVTEIEGESFGYSFKEIDVTEIINKAIQEVPLMMKNKHLEVLFENITNRAIMIYGDQIKLGIVFRNVIQNAVDYSYDMGKIIIALKQKDENVVIDIQDFGVGISPEDKEHLFTKFYRSDSARKMETDRSGLGLYIVKGIMEKHNGTMTVSSKVGEGTIVTITLPCITAVEVKDF